MRRFLVKLADGRSADVAKVEITDTFEGVLEARCFSDGTDEYLSRYEERRGQIEAGNLKGFYCFEPELIDEYRMEMDPGTGPSPRWTKRFMGKCFKDNKLSVLLTFDEPGGKYGITLEWYQTTQELAEIPLVSLIQDMAGTLNYDEIRKYYEFIDWE